MQDDALFLGIDGGGTGCRAVLGDAAGRILARAEGSGANIVTDPEGALRSILDVTRRVLAEAGNPASADRLSAGMGLAGANVPSAVGRLRGGLPFARSRIENDVVIALLGAHAGADGVVASLGTGSVFGVCRGGQLRMIGGWGFVLGDEGSGAALGRAALGLALRALDGLAPASGLLTALVAEFGGAAQMVEFAQTARPDAFARLAPRILAAARQGDAAAEALLNAATQSVAQSINLLQGDTPLPLAFLGGLGPTYAARLAERYGALIRPALGTPLDGALVLARRP